MSVRWDNVRPATDRQAVADALNGYAGSLDPLSRSALFATFDRAEPEPQGTVALTPLGEFYASTNGGDIPARNAAIRQFYNVGFSADDLADLFHLTPSTIRAICFVGQPKRGRT